MFLHFDFESTFDFEATTSHLLVIIQIYKIFGGFLHLIRLSFQMSDEPLFIAKKALPFCSARQTKGKGKRGLYTFHSGTRITYPLGYGIKGYMNWIKL